jgi:hypothetical protein
MAFTVEEGADLLLRCSGCCKKLTNGRLVYRGIEHPWCGDFGCGVWMCVTTDSRERSIVCLWDSFLGDWVEDSGWEWDENE